MQRPEREEEADWGWRVFPFWCVFRLSSLLLSSLLSSRLLSPPPLSSPLLSSPLLSSPLPTSCLVFPSISFPLCFLSFCDIESFLVSLLVFSPLLRCKFCSLLFHSFCLVRSVLMSPFDSFISLNLSSSLARAALLALPFLSFLFLSLYSSNFPLLFVSFLFIFLYFISVSSLLPIFFCLSVSFLSYLSLFLLFHLLPYFVFTRLPIHFTNVPPGSKFTSGSTADSQKRRGWWETCPLNGSLFSPSKIASPAYAWKPHSSLVVFITCSPTLPSALSVVGPVRRYRAQRIAGFCPEWLAVFWDGVQHDGCFVILALKL